MSKFCYDFGKDQPHDEEEIMKIWYASKVSELNEMVEDRDQGEVILEYITWFHDTSSFRDRLEGSNMRRNDQRTIEKLKEELEHAQMTIAKQQAQQQAGVAQIYLNIEKDYQSALWVMDKDLKQAKNEAARLQEELANTIGLVRRVEANQNAEIHKLQEDLSIIEEDAHQQQLEFDQQKEQFNIERAHWICSKSQIYT
uniref:Autophagy-related protein 11-like n=1 Tax=Nicotiana sylvestris TaxID=4096 RepID=A0A1U7UZ77_NICSY|nr:PREDICTED: autophagy-related protein 11-like [Nicotiana sylvestris]